MIYLFIYLGSQHQEQRWGSIHCWLVPWVLHVVMVVSSVILEGLGTAGRGITQRCAVEGWDLISG